MCLCVRAAEWSVAAMAGPGTQQWKSVASSGDGTHLFATYTSSIDGPTLNGMIWLSTDSGATWTTRSDAGSSGRWTSVSCSSDGVKLIVTRDGVAQLSISVGTGALVGTGPIGTYADAAFSSDGTKIVVAAGGIYQTDGTSVPGYIHRSKDSGAIWTAISGLGYWISIASSSDGERLIACQYRYPSESAPTQLSISSDGGLTWSATGPFIYWRSVASSSDGTTLLAAGYSIVSTDSALVVSTNSGSTWTAVGPGGYAAVSGGYAAAWYAAAVSGDGTKMAAAQIQGINNSPGQMHFSVDSGVTWMAQGPTGMWNSAAASSDGTQVVAAQYDSGQIYRFVYSADISTPPPPPPPPPP